MVLTIDVDYVGSETDAKIEGEAFGIEIIPTGLTSADVKGTKENLTNWLIDVHGIEQQEAEWYISEAEDYIKMFE